MIVVAMADDQRLDFGRVDAEQLDVVEQGLGGIAEVEHDRALPPAARCDSRETATGPTGYGTRS